MFLTAQILMLALWGSCFAMLFASLPLKKNLLLFFVLAQAFVYCFAAPSYVAYEQQLAGTELGAWYAYAQALCLLVFLPVCLLIYRITGKRAPRNRGRVSPCVNGKMLPLFAIFSCGGAVGYLMILAAFGLLFRRIGHNALAAEYLQLPTLVFLFIRTFDRLLLSLILINYLCARFSSTPSQKRLSVAAFLTTLLVQLMVAGINSRSELINTFALLAIVHFLSEAYERKRSAVRVPIRAIAIVSTCLIGLVFTMKFREQWQGTVRGTLNAVVNDASETREEIAGAIYKVATRLDGVDLIARMGPSLQDDGFSYGRSWYPSVLVTFGYLWDPEGARSIKANLATTPKYYLMYEYAGINEPDYQSCILTDAYGNLGIAGIALAAIVLGFNASAVSRTLASPQSRVGLIFAVIGLQVVAQFEVSLVNHLLFNWLRHAPSSVVLYFLCPLRLERQQRALPVQARNNRLLTYRRVSRPSAAA
jgi:hypothetical protein